MRLNQLKTMISESTKAPFKELYGRAVTRVLQSVAHDLDPDRSIFVLGTPRSGTTLVMELLATLPGSYPVFEPLNRTQDPRLADFLRDDWVRLTAADEFPKLEAFLEDVRCGRHLSRWSSAHASLRQLASARRLVIKFIRINRGAGWLGARFPRNPKILVLRHPCAVVSSMLRSPGIWHDWPPRYVLDPIRAQFGPSLSATLDRIDTRAELFAAFWCADTALALAESDRSQTTVLPYEDLIVDPERALQAIFSHVGEEVPAGALGVLTRPSRTANPGAAVRTGANPLEAWKKNLDADAVGRILRVVEGFGIRIYTDELLPDLASLSHQPRTPGG